MSTGFSPHSSVSTFLKPQCLDSQQKVEERDANWSAGLAAVAGGRVVRGAVGGGQQ